MRDICSYCGRPTVITFGDICEDCYKMQMEAQWIEEKKIRAFEEWQQKEFVKPFQLVVGSGWRDYVAS